MLSIAFQETYILNYVLFTATSFRVLEHEFRQHNTTRWDGPMCTYYSTHANRMQSYTNWPVTSEQKAKDLSDAGFFYTGKNI
jgi:hypothetical protein